MNENFLLKTEGAVRLYNDYAKNLPIIDFHNHLSVSDIAADRKYADLAEIWLAADPYKHRLMRICGVEEHFITGSADPYEKFEKYCEVFPLLAGNPVYDWSRMELHQIFGIEQLPSRETAKYIYDRAGEMLRSPEYSNNGILKGFGIEYQSPVATLMDDLSGFDGKTIAPSLRGDNLLSPSKELLAQLKAATKKEITDNASYMEAVCVMLDKFAAAGCRFADHALDSDFFEADPDGSKANMLVALGNAYAKRGWTLLLHIGAKRKTSPLLLKLAGTNGCFASAGNRFDFAAVCDLLGQMEAAGGLPDTVLFPLNISDQATTATMQGSFSQDGVASKVQLGPAWWWCDHALGIRNTLSCIASFGVVSRFIGMTTDSRSILSFARHDYFRRILCAWIDEQNTTGDWELSFPMQGQMVRAIAYQNAKDKIHI